LKRIIKFIDNTVMRITDKIHILKIDFEIAISPEKKIQRFVNAIIIFGSKITVIDSGVKGSEEKIFACIKQNKRDFKEINKLILSHAHPDHIGSAAKIKELTRCAVFSHELEREWIENIDLQINHRPVPGFLNLADKSVEVDHLISDKDEITADDGITLQFIHSPGHSPGSLNILFKEDQILFTADSIPLKNDIPNYHNYLQLMQSLRAIKENKNYEILLTSWTPPLSEIPEIRILLQDGEEYMKKIDAVVKNNYTGDETAPFQFCKATVEQLGLPAYLVNPIVDRAFRSHFKH
jgi:hydroxyacylglutathione hydrolase